MMMMMMLLMCVCGYVRELRERNFGRVCWEAFLRRLGHKDTCCYYWGFCG